MNDNSKNGKRGSCVRQMVYKIKNGASKEDIVRELQPHFDFDVLYYWDRCAGHAANQPTTKHTQTNGKIEQITLPEAWIKPIAFTDLYQLFVDASFVPCDEVMNKVAVSMGYSGTNAHAARKRLERNGYEFEKVEFGFLVEQKLSQEAEELLKLQKEFEGLRIRINELAAKKERASLPRR